MNLAIGRELWAEECTDIYTDKLLTKCLECATKWNMQGYKSLETWNEAMALTEFVYRLTKLFPKEERYGFVSQMQRAAISIPSNIAEGKGRRSDKEVRKFCLIANGSAKELETQLILIERLKLADQHAIVETQNKLNVVLRLLARFINTLDLAIESEERKRSRPIAQGS